MPYGDWTVSTGAPSWHISFSYPKINGYGDTVYDITHGLIDEIQEDSDVAFQALVDLIQSSPDFTLLGASKSELATQQVTRSEVSDGN